MDVRLNVNGFDVNAHFDDESVHSVLLPLLRGFIAKNGT